MKKRNFQVLAERWPDVLSYLEGASGRAAAEAAWRETPRGKALVIGNIQLAGAYDARAEVELLARLVPREAVHATVYGMAQGGVVRELLRRPALESLDVVLLSAEVALASLSELDHEDWLADPRVRVLRPSACAEVAMPFVASVAELRLTEEEGARLRDLVQLELNTPHIRRHVQAGEGALRERLVENTERVRRDGDVSELFDTRAGATVLVAAAGPTLSDHYERLAHRSADEVLIACDACLKPLIAAGVSPDFVVTMDSHHEGVIGLLNTSAEATRDITLVYDPVVHPDAIDLWTGPRLAFYPDRPRYAELRRELPRGSLWTSGSVIHPAVDLACRMGAAKVRFFGADFATPGGKSHVQGFTWRRDLAERADGTWVLNEAGERVPSLPNLVGYLRDLERYLARATSARFENAGHRGARIEAAPFVRATGQELDHA